MNRSGSMVARLGGIGRSTLVRRPLNLTIGGSQLQGRRSGTPVHRFRSSHHFAALFSCELRTQKCTGKPMNLVRFLTRSSYDEHAAKLMGTSNPPNQALPGPTFSASGAACRLGGVPIPKYFWQRSRPAAEHSNFKVELSGGIGKTSGHAGERNCVRPLVRRQEIAGRSATNPGFGRCRPREGDPCRGPLSRPRCHVPRRQADQSRGWAIPISTARAPGAGSAGWRTRPDPPAPRHPGSAPGRAAAPTHRPRLRRERSPWLATAPAPADGAC